MTKNFIHPDAPDVIVEADAERELLLVPSGWVEKTENKVSEKN